MFSFSRLTRLPLRRCLHTRSAATQPAFNLSRFARFALVSSVVTTAYLSWHLASEKNHIALDSQSKPSSAGQSSTTIPKPSPESPEPSFGAEHPSPFAPEDSSIPAEDHKTSGDTEEEGSEEAEEGNAASGGAYNPETGEINWDCPCLGGMAHGPCGTQFREAFSCFVFSEDEPKGINCIEKFQQMQDCFRAHPEIYADEIMSDDDEEPSVPVNGQTHEDDDSSRVGHAEGVEPPALSHPEKPTDKVSPSVPQ